MRGLRGCAATGHGGCAATGHKELGERVRMPEVGPWARSRHAPGVSRSPEPTEAWIHVPGPRTHRRVGS